MSRKEVSVHQGKRHNLLSPHASTQDQICYRKTISLSQKEKSNNIKVSTEDWSNSK
jgi:hypothetical protein